MYAVIETGGKQYRVEVGTELEVELLDAEPGAEITLDRVLLVADGDEASIGHPTVADATVLAEVVRRDRGPKLINFKYGPKTRRRVKKGHRQELLVLRIADITLGGKSAAALVAKATDAKKTERARLEEAAARQAAEDAALAAKLARKADATADAADATADAAVGADATAEVAEVATKKARSARPKAQADAPALPSDDDAGDSADAVETPMPEDSSTKKGS